VVKPPAGAPGAAGMLAGRYEPRARLGARTLRAWDTKRRREVVIRTYPAAGPDAIARHLSAVAAAKRAGQPSLVLPLELVTAGVGAPFAVCEPLVGQDLAALLRAGPLLWVRAADITTRVATTLAAVTAATGVAHRDLRAGSVWVGEAGEISVLDFAAAEFGLTPVAAREDGTFAESRAPEQLDGSAGDARSDVHALGLLLYEMTTGVHPFAAESAFKATHNLLMQPTPSLTTLVRGLPEVALRAADEVIERALARRPEERHKNCGELLRALELARRTVGAPVHRVVAPPRATVAKPEPKAEDSDEFTTMLSLRVMREAMPPAAAPPLAEPALAAPVAPAPQARAAVPEAEPTEMYRRVDAGREPEPARFAVVEASAREPMRAPERFAAVERTETLELARLPATARADATLKLRDGPARPETTVPLRDGLSAQESIDDAATTAHRRIDEVASAVAPMPDVSQADLRGMSGSQVQPDASTTGIVRDEPGSSRGLLALNVLCAVLIVVGLLLLWAL
jgi:hypothetical protein